MSLWLHNAAVTRLTQLKYQKLCNRTLVLFASCSWANPRHRSCTKPQRYWSHWVYSILGTEVKGSRLKNLSLGEVTTGNSFRFWPMLESRKDCGCSEILMHRFKLFADVQLLHFGYSGKTKGWTWLTKLQLVMFLNCNTDCIW